jgi:hypothetical protein
VEPEGIHFLDGLFDSPIVFRDAVGRDHNTAAVFTIFAMDKNLLARRAAQKAEEFSDLLVGRWRPATNRNVDVAETERFDAPALGLDFVTPTAKIDDRGDAEFLEFSETQLRRLRATQEKVVYLASVANSRDCNLLRGGGNVRQCGGGGLRESSRRRDPVKKKNYETRKKCAEMQRGMHRRIVKCNILLPERERCGGSATNELVEQKHDHYK